jgi:hypothetical protein
MTKGATVLRTSSMKFDMSGTKPCATARARASNLGLQTKAKHLAIKVCSAVVSEDKPLSKLYLKTYELSKRGMQYVCGRYGAWPQQTYRSLMAELSGNPKATTPFAVPAKSASADMRAASIVPGMGMHSRVEHLLTCRASSRSR